MIRLLFGNAGEELHINSPLTLFAAIMIGVIGPEVFIVQPGFVQGLVEYYNFGEKEAGYIASAEMWGIAATTVAVAIMASRCNWRYIIGVSIALVAIGNIASIFSDSTTGFALWRLLAGIGSGGLISLSFTIIGLTDNPDRNFGYLIMAVLTYGALGLLAMPTAFALVGLKGVILFFALFALAALPLIRFLPESGDNHTQVEADAINLPAASKVMAILTMLFYFTGQGVVWAYLFLIGVNGGAGEQQVANGLTFSQFLGIGGAFTAVIVGRRFGRLPPITAGILGGIVPLLFLFGEMGALVYGISVCVYNYAWNMTHPFLLAALASFDRRGQVVVYGVAAQMLGLAIGPAVAAYFIAPGDYSNVNWLGMGFFAVALMLIVQPVLEQRRRSQVISRLQIARGDQITTTRGVGNPLNSDAQEAQ